VLEYKKEWYEKINPGESGKYAYYITLEGKDDDGNTYEVDYDAYSNGCLGWKKTRVEELSKVLYIKQIKK
jgi:hypothetical protein